MYISISFEDRVAPYTKFCSSREEVEIVKKSWEQHYILTEIKCTPSPHGNNYFYTAKERR